ncbi:MAG: NAD(P)/FAD-dependent oxidoreductase [Catalinimonas sp.]
MNTNGTLAPAPEEDIFFPSNRYGKSVDLNIPDSPKPRVVVIGGGFAGINFLRQLDMDRFQVVLFDRHNYHTFQPLLYQVATAGLEPDAIAGPLRQLFEPAPDFYFRLGTADRIVPEKNQVITSLGPLDYDLLVIANGTRTNYFGQDEKFKKAFPLKQVPQALNLRSHMLQCLEKAVLSEGEERQALLNFVFVGGGPTGVEMAGAFGELKQHVLPNDYDELNLDQMNIYLVEGTGRLLNGMSDYAGRKAKEYLKKFDVKLMLEQMVESYDGDVVLLKGGEEIKAKTVVWAAGVEGNLVEGMSEKAVEKGNRLRVDRYNRVQGYGNIYALGDIAAMTSEKWAKGHPQLAPVAIQQGKHLAKNLNRMLRGQPLRPFKYVDKGYMATVGRNRAVADLPFNIHLGGFPAWISWMGIHLIFLVGFRSKIVTLTNWTYNYFTYDRGVRLIIRPSHRNPVNLPVEREAKHPAQTDY